MRISISGLPPGPQTFDQSTSASDYLDDAETFPEDIQITATLQREGNTLRLDLSVEMLARFTCDRCGQPFSRRHRCLGDFFFAFDDGSSRSDNREVALIPRRALELDISQEIRDLVILGLPIRILCREDCKGLCPDCGANLNFENCSCRKEEINPRWEALRQLRG